MTQAAPPEHRARRWDAKLAWWLALVVLAGGLFLLAWSVDSWPSLSDMASKARLLWGQVFAHLETGPRPVTLTVFMVVYVLVSAFFLPGTGLLNISGAVIFGFWTGALVIIASRALGAILACTVARRLLRRRVTERFSDRVAVANRALAREGVLYLFLLRTVPGIPFQLTNMVMGLTDIPLSTFFWVSLASFVPTTLISANAACQVSRAGLTGAMSPEVLVSLALVGLVPLVIKRLYVSYVDRKSGS